MIISQVKFITIIIISFKLIGKIDEYIKFY
jgi:hypothetical protein